MTSWKTKCAAPSVEKCILCCRTVA